jgi:hypothetical protein
MVALPGHVVAADASWWKGRRGTSSAGAAHRQPQSRLQLDVAEEEGRTNGEPTEADPDGAAHRASLAPAIFHSAKATRADVEDHQFGFERSSLAVFLAMRDVEPERASGSIPEPG